MNHQASRLIQLRQLAGTEKFLHSGKIISICSGKGGTGKTFFAANFAFQLARLNKRVLLVDLDLNFSNVNILLNQTSKNAISHFFEQTKSLNEIIYEYAPNLDLIYGDSGREDFPRVSTEVLDYFFLALIKVQENYDFIILDSSAGADKLLLHQLIKSDFSILVTSPEPTAVMDAYVVVKMLREANTELYKYVVVNKTTDKQEAEGAFQNLSTAVKHFLQDEVNYLGKISFDAGVHKSIVNQELLCRYDLNSSASKEIFTISTQFLNNIHVANNNHSSISF
jgi:flagellar biosynthesis protein FlhG